MIQVLDKAARALAAVSREPGIDLKRLAGTLGLKKPGNHRFTTLRQSLLTSLQPGAVLAIMWLYV